MIYDTVLNITWLQDANYANTSGYDPGGFYTNGRMNWTDAKTWAQNLIYGGYDDWRLPTALNTDGNGPCGGVWCSNSELGHMFYNNMGASSGQSIHSGSNSANLALFANVAPYPPGVNGIYWSSTPVSGSVAWVFNTYGGVQGTFTKSFNFYAWAVRDGDVASPVPLPATVWLLLSGLGGLARLGRRRAG
jgi:hypothetical protein